MGHHSEELNNRLIGHKEKILSKWFQLILGEYSKEAVIHMAKGKNQFQNPMGHSIYQGLEGIINYLIDDKGQVSLEQYLDKILRIKAVQDTSPAEAIEFLFKLKRVLKEELAGLTERDLLLIGQKIDEIVLLAVNVYVACREKIYQIRLDEVKKRCEILERYKS